MHWSLVCLSHKWLNDWQWLAFECTFSTFLHHFDTSLRHPAGPLVDLRITQMVDDDWNLNESFPQFPQKCEMPAAHCSQKVVGKLYAWLVNSFSASWCLILLWGKSEKVPKMLIKVISLRSTHSVLLVTCYGAVCVLWMSKAHRSPLL